MSNDMHMGDNVSVEADEFADVYDETVLRHGWNSPEIIFSLMKEHLAAGDTLLDLGIGTGLSAVPFHKAGISVSGLDCSGKMLERCRSKGVAVELKRHDIRSAPMPFSDRCFDHVVACGVFHLIAHLEGIFADVRRLIRDTGSFAFSVELLEADLPQEGELIEEGILEICNDKAAVRSYRHSQAHVEGLMARHNFDPVGLRDYVAYPKTDWADERHFRAYLARLSDSPTTRDSMRTSKCPMMSREP